MAITIYDLKPAFINLLRPVAVKLVKARLTANHVTVIACILSCLLGLALYCLPLSPWLWSLLPLWLFVRMALNAIDGIMAREFGQKSRLGALLNETGDIIADVALIIPFASIMWVDKTCVAAFAWMALLTEFAGVLALVVNTPRRYDGPMGKSDRAFFLGVMAVLVAISAALGPDALPWWVGKGVDVLFWLASGLMALTTFNRLRNALKQARQEAIAAKR